MFGSYEGLSEQLQTRKNSSSFNKTQQAGKSQNNNPFIPMAKPTINRGKLKDQEDVRKFLTKFF